MKYVGWRPYLSDLRYHRRRDESASGRGLSAKKKTTQPGTGAQAMEKPVQTSLVDAGGGEVGENPRNRTGSFRTQRASSCSPLSGRVLMFPIVAGSDVRVQRLQKVFSSPWSTIRHGVSASHFPVRGPLSLRTGQTSNLHLGIWLNVEKPLGRSSLPRALARHPVESAAENPGTWRNRELWRSCSGARNTNGRREKRSPAAASGRRDSLLEAGLLGFSGCICYHLLCPLCGARGLRSPFFAGPFWVSAGEPTGLRPGFGGGRLSSLP